MSRTFLTAFVVGIAVIGLAVAGLLVLNRGSRVGLDCRILKVRTAPLDENSSVAVIDFRLHNPSNVQFWVRTVTVVLEDKDGKQYEGATVSETDAKRMFEALPLLGQKFDNTLVMGDKIPSQAIWDRMVAARFEAPESRIDARKRFLVRIEDVDGPITEISEK
jgi:hypothetical protein